jgi:hypothetical protein
VVGRDSAPGGEPFHPDGGGASAFCFDLPASTFPASVQLNAKEDWLTVAWDSPRALLISALMSPLTLNFEHNGLKDNNPEDEGKVLFGGANEQHSFASPLCADRTQDGMKSERWDGTGGS